MRKEVTGMAKDMASTYSQAPMGDTEKGPGKEAGPLKASKVLRAPMPPNGGTVDTKNYGMTKGPMGQSLGRTGMSMGGNGQGRFTGTDQQKIMSSGTSMPNRVK